MHGILPQPPNHPKCNSKGGVNLANALNSQLLQTVLERWWDPVISLARWWGSNTELFAHCGNKG